MKENSAYIDRNGILCIPANAPEHQRWWLPGVGQSIMDTLKEIGASEEIIEKYQYGGKQSK